MKHKLLSLFALAGAMFMSTSVWAFDPPVKPTAAPLVYPVESDAWVAPEVGGTYYIYNVGTGQFLGAGNDWGTRCVTTATATGIAEPNGSTINLATNVSHILPFTIEEAAAATPEGDVVLWNLIHLGTKHSTDGNKFLCHEGNSAWTDGGESRRVADLNGFWKVEAANDAYILRCTTAKKVMDGETQAQTDEETPRLIFSDLTFDEILGVDFSKTITTTSNTWADKAVGGANNSLWKFISADNLTAVTEILNGRTAATEAYQALLDDYEKVVEAYNVAMGIYNAKVSLQATLDAAVAAGVSETDINAAVAIYESETATEAEVLAANTSLQLTIKLKGATPPVDITSVLQNPDFEIGNISGWETNYVSGKQALNIGYQGASYTNGEVHIEKFIEAWKDNVSPYVIGDGYLQQTIYGLPAGKYRLECDAISTYQHSDPAGSNPATGVYLFIQSGVLEARTALATGNGAPEHFTVEFDNDGGKGMIFGLKTVSATANWIAADNFKLWYDGELTESPHYKNLKDKLAEVQDQYNNEDFAHAYLCQDSLEALDAAMLVADGITSNDTDDDCDAAYEALEKAYTGVLTSIKVYATLLPYTTLNEEGSKLAYYEEATAANKWDALSQQLHNQQEDFDTAYDEGTWSDDEVKAKIDGILPSIIAWVQAHPEALSKGNDLTFLLINPDFSQGSYSSKAEEFDGDENSIPGWTLSSGNITELRHSTGNIETYHKKFDFNQTIKNMPAGVYDITVQGFVRHDGSATDQTIFYAGDLKTQLMQCSDQSSAEGVWLTTTEEKPALGEENHDVENKVLGGYQCNGMTGFYYWSITEAESGGNYLKYQDGDLYYTNHIKATLNEPGDFTIGMQSLGTSDWIIWDNFQIIYIGDDASVYPEMAEEDFNALTNALNNTDYPTLKAKADYAEIAKEDYSAIATLEAYNAYKAKVDALIAYIQEGTKLGNTLHDLLSEYGEKVNVVMFDTSDFLDGHYSEYSTNLENGTCPDNDYLRNAPDVLATEWTQCAVKQANTALFNNLGDIIINPQYTTVGGVYTLDGWNLEKEEEVTVKNVAGEGVAEVYNPSGEYKFYQTIQGLSEGYYRVTVDGFFRPGDMKQSDGREACVAIPSRAYLFAESGDETWTSPLKNILVGHDALEGVGSESTWTWGDPEQGDETLEYTPNDVAAANQYFNGVHNDYAEATNLSGENEMQSVYRNVVNAYVGEDGILTIGISNHGFEPATNDWACFSNWTLSYMGTEAPDAVKGISVKGATAPAAIFTIDGRQASRLQRGMNIVRQTNGDVKKVLVK